MGIPLPLLVTVLTFSLVFCEVSFNNFPFRRCSRSDPEINQCIVDSLNEAKGRISTGMPKVGLGSLLPMKGDEVDIQEGPADLNLHLKFKDFAWSGLHDYTVTRARVDFKRPYLELQIYSPETRVTGPYTITGKVLTLTIFGNGHITLDMNGLNVTHQIDLEEVTRDGTTFWQVKRYYWPPRMDEMKVNLTNLFGGNKRLGLYANQFINANWNLALTVYGRNVGEAVGRFLRTYSNAFLAKVPLDTIFAP